jgi:hypothetical protein
VKVKGSVAFAAIVAVAGVTVGTAGVALAPPAATKDGVTVTLFAAAPPAGAVFVTFTVNVTDCPTLIVAGGCVAKATLSPATAWTVTPFVLTGPADSAAPVFASVPLAVARNVSPPAAAAT